MYSLKGQYRTIIQRYLKAVEPDQVAQRKANRLVRCTFYAVGVNHFWAMDQHDKWKRFGLFWHGCVDGFTGKILWLVVWWTNSNPRFVCVQYLDAVRGIGGTFLAYYPLSWLSNDKQVGSASPKATKVQRITMWHMHTCIFTMCLILCLLAPFNTIGSLVTQTSKQNKCGGDSIKLGFLASNIFWRKGLRSNGMTLSMLQISTYVNVHRDIETYKTP